MYEPQHNPAAAPLMTPGEAAAFLRLALGTVNNWRSRGTGPAFVRVGRRVRYRLADLQAYLDARTDDPQLRSGAAA